MKPLRIIISGGGTGGHIFPAIAIANEIRMMHPDSEILFVGALGKMEMEKVPQAGYRIEGLPIAGFQRRLTVKNLLVPFKVIQSLAKARTIIREFKPDVAVGVGGYASGPLLRMAAMMGIPTVIQEQNSYPGITNKILAKNASLICVAYEGLEKWFPKEKILLTGNPVRAEVIQIEGKREKALTHFQLENDRPVILAIGGSLGARTINESVHQSAVTWIDTGFQIIWQTGKSYQPTAQAFAEQKKCLFTQAFIYEMDLAYAAADIIISRAGAMSIAELGLIAKPCIFVPSPHVAEDHQTKNAMALVKRDAAELVPDAEAKSKLGDRVIQLMIDTARRKQLAENLKALGKRDAAEVIARQIVRIARAER